MTDRLLKEEVAPVPPEHESFVQLRVELTAIPDEGNAQKLGISCSTAELGIKEEHFRCSWRARQRSGVKIAVLSAPCG